jgi:hypothetical protein
MRCCTKKIGPFDSRRMSTAVITRIGANRMRRASRRQVEHALGDAREHRHAPIGLRQSGVESRFSIFTLNASR